MKTTTTKRQTTKRRIFFSQMLERVGPAAELAAAFGGIGFGAHVPTQHAGIPQPAELAQQLPWAWAWYVLNHRRSCIDAPVLDARVGALHLRSRRPDMPYCNVSVYRSFPRRPFPIPHSDSPAFSLARTFRRHIRFESWPDRAKNQLVNTLEEIGPAST